MMSQNKQAQAIETSKISWNMRKELIVDAGVSLFVEKGFSASVNELITRIGIAKGTFYHHFADKETFIIDLYKALMLEVEQVCVSIEKCNDHRTYDRHVFGAIVQWFLTHPVKFHYISIFETSPYLKKQGGFVENTLAHPRQIILQKIDMGVLKAYPTDMIAFFDFSFTRGSANYFLSQPDPMSAFENGFDAAFDMYWNGVAR